MKAKPRRSYRDLTHDPAIRALQEQLNAEHADQRCYDGWCEHGTPAPALPKGVIAIVTRAWARRDGTSRVTLVRYRKGDRRWNVVRADNERVLGWVCKQEYGEGEYAGQWEPRINSAAFRGTSVGDEGDLLDQVPDWRFKGDGNGGSRSLNYEDSRFWAARAIIDHLDDNAATALGHGPHPNVVVWRTRASQHFELGEDAEKYCSCGHSLPCPLRAQLAEQEAQLTGARS